MAIEVRCPGCGRTLRVADEHAGKQLRCPACQQISTAPGGQGDGREGSHISATEAATWHMRTPDGQVFGPVTWSQIQQWVAEGRVAADCQLANSISGPWRAAVECFPVLRPQAGGEKRQAPSLHAWAPRDTAGEEVGTFTPASPFGSAGQQFVKPHRGGLILVLGILGIAINCPLFCFMAWVMGSSDLAEMREGRMDRSGEAMTQVGRVLGMIISLFWIVGGVVLAMVILFAAVAGQ